MREREGERVKNRKRKGDIGDRELREGKGIRMNKI